MNRLHERQYTVKLIDKGILNRMLSPLLPITPWENVLYKDIEGYKESDMIRHRFICTYEYDEIK